ncbi:MAG: adenylosuccinate synthase [Planctomycetes bacterium]|nr:adenylosuccinate synthase [Planctomycetota bacterium]
MSVVGMQWGDEGKGKIIDLCTEEFDVIVRYQGGSNAGHTVVVGEKKFVLHLVPSGILHERKLCVVGNGVAFDPPLFIEEMEGLRREGVEIKDNLKVSDRAHVVFPYHKVLDQLGDGRGGDPKIGTTGRGIGPCYTDKMARCGFRVAELLDGEHFREKLKWVLEAKNLEIRTRYEQDPLSYDEIADTFSGYAETIRPFVADTVTLLDQEMKRGARILFEGAQGSLLDVDFGTYPFISSSNASACGVSVGAGVPPRAVGKVLGIMKAYTTRVGEGPFPTELTGDHGEELRQKGGEFGATTGRPRRCGWLDAVAVRHAATINGAANVALTKLDVLSGQKNVNICTAYRCNGETLTHFPANTAVLDHVEPVYETFSGWDEDICGARKFSDLPSEAGAYVRAIEDAVELDVEIISVGSERDEIIRV